MSFFDDASLVMIPSGYKASKVYSVKPTDGTGDLVFTRALDTATRVGPDGLIEKVRTNFFTHSENFTNAVWTPANVAVTANTTTAPNGTLTADSVLSTLATGEHGIRFTTSMAVSTEHTVSVYAKQITTRYAYIRDLTNNQVSVFDLQNGVVSSQGANHVASILAEGSFYRISITFQTPAVIVNNLVDFGITASSSNFISTITIGEGIALWGAQLETGALTPYIPTTTAAVSVGPLANVPRLDYLNSSCPRLLLEPQRSNLALNSESFDNATWTKTNVTITANNLISPDGTQDADLANFTSGSNSINAGTVFGGNASVTISTFVKIGTISIFRIRESFYSGVSCVFDLSDETTGAGGKIDNYGNGWYRCSFTYTLGVGQTNINWIFDSNTAIGSLYLWGAQAEVGADATSYIPTLGAAVTRSADSASKTGITALIGQTEGTIFAEINVAKLLGIQSRYILTISDNTANNRIYIAFSGSSSNILRARIFSGGVLQATIDTGTISSLGTYKLALAYNNNDAVLYVNGVQIGTDTSVTVPACSQLNVCANQASASPFDDGIKQALLFKTRLTNAALAELTA